MAYGRGMKKLRIEFMNQTQDEFAATLGITKRHLIKLENNYLGVTHSLMGRIAASVKIPLPILMKTYFPDQVDIGTTEALRSLRSALKKRMQILFPSLSFRSPHMAYMSLQDNAGRLEVGLVFKTTALHAYICAASELPSHWPEEDIEEESGLTVFIGTKERFIEFLNKKVLPIKFPPDIWTDTPELASSLVKDGSKLFDFRRLFEVIGLPENTNIIQYSKDTKAGTRQGMIMDTCHAMRISYDKMINV